jgi:hypothetical protein
MTGEFVQNDSYTIAAAGKGETTHLNLTLSVFSRDAVLVDGPRVELPLCDVGGFMLVTRYVMSGPSKRTIECTAEEGAFIKLTRLGDLIQFKAREAGATSTLDTTKTIANVELMLADLERVMDAVIKRLDGGVVSWSRARPDIQRHHGLN